MQVQSAGLGVRGGGEGNHQAAVLFHRHLDVLIVDHPGVVLHALHNAFHRLHRHGPAGGVVENDHVAEGLEKVLPGPLFIRVGNSRVLAGDGAVHVQQHRVQHGVLAGIAGLVDDVFVEHDADVRVRVGGVHVLALVAGELLRGLGRGFVQGVDGEFFHRVRAVAVSVHSHIVHIVRALPLQSADVQGKVRIGPGGLLAVFEAVLTVDYLELGVLAVEEPVHAILVRVVHAGLLNGILRALLYGHPVHGAVLVDGVGQPHGSGLGVALNHVVQVKAGRGDVLGLHGHLKDAGRLGSVRIGKPQIQVVVLVLLQFAQAFRLAVQVHVNVVDLEAVHGVLDQPHPSVSVGVWEGVGQELAGLRRGAAAGQKHIVQVAALGGHYRGLNIHQLKVVFVDVGVVPGGGPVRKGGELGSHGRGAVVRGQNLLGLHRAAPPVGVHQQGGDVVGTALV